MVNYFWLVFLPNIGFLFSLLGLIGLIFCVLYWVGYFATKYDPRTKDRNEEDRFCHGVMFIASLVVMVLLLLGFFIPSKKEIIQLKLLSAATELKGADQIPQKIVNKINNLLDEKD
jgi:Na+/H+ antiporter NhaD/arsenite permease-like protein